MKAASISIRVLAVAQAIVAFKIVWLERAQRALFDDRTGTDDLLKSLQRLYQISRVVSFTLMALSLAAMVAFATTRTKDRGRALAWGGVIAFGVHAAMSIGFQFMKMEGPPSEAIRWAWWAEGALESIGFASILFAIALPARRGVAAAIGFSVLAAVELVVGIVLRKAENLSRNASFAYMVFVASVFVVFAVVAFVLARHVGSDPKQAKQTYEGERGAGGPLRLLAWSTLARVGVGIGVAVLAVLSMSSGDASAASSATMLGAMFGLIAGIAAISGLLGHARTRTGAPDAGVVGFAVVATVIAGAMDLWAAFTATELFDMVDKAKRATSFWGMPSLSKLEEMQDGIRWAARGQMVLGVVTVLVLATAFRGTAERVGATAQADRAGRVRILAIVAGILGILGHMMLEKPKAAEEALMFAVVALFVAIAMLTSWTRLLFGLADEIERPTVSPPTT